MRIPLLLLVCPIFLSTFLFLIEPPFATGRPQAKIAAHLGAYATDSPLGRCSLEIVPGCSSMKPRLQTRGEVRKPYILYLMLVSADPSIAAVEFGISYFPSPAQGLLLSQWQTCAGTQLPIQNDNGQRWPAPGSGNRLFFGPEVRTGTIDQDSQQTLVLGSFYVYAYGEGTFEFRPYPHERTRLAAVANTDFEQAWLTYPDDYAVVAFGSGSAAESRDPCTAADQIASAGRHVIVVSDNLKILPASPNPVPPAGYAIWQVGSAADRNVQLRIYSIRGNLVRAYDRLALQKGTTQFLWDRRDEAGRAVPSGKYFLEVSGDHFRALQSVVLLR